MCSWGKFWTKCPKKSQLPLLKSSEQNLGEKAMAPYSSTLAWKIPWMEETGRLQSMRVQGVRCSRPSLSFITTKGAGIPPKTSSRNQLKPHILRSEQANLLLVFILFCGHRSPSKALPEFFDWFPGNFY